MQPPPKLTTHLVQIQQAARDVTLGQISVGEFATQIARLQQLFQRRLDEVRALIRDEVPDDFLPEIADEMNVGQRGIELYLAATDAFLAYVETRDLDQIQRGLTLSAEANELVNQALMRNWQTWRTYQQTAEEYVQQVQNGIIPPI